MSSSSNSSLFTGSSQFSASLAQQIQRAVQFASLPMQQRQNELNALEAEQSTAQTLNNDFANVQSVIAQLQAATTGTNAFSAFVANPSTGSAVASVTLTDTPTAGSYTLTVTNPGSYASSMSSDGLTKVATPTAGNVSNATSYTLSIGSSASYTVTPAGTSLSDLVQALNIDGHVQATMVNLGTTASPDYRLSLQGTQLGDLPIQLTASDGSSPGQTLLTAENPPGAPAQYQVNGQPSTPIQSGSSTVTLSPGVSVKLLAAGTATVSVSPSTMAVSNVLSKLAGAYNTAMADLNRNRGQGGGSMAGDSLVMTLSGTLRNVVGYSTGNSGISSLTSLGFSFDQNGVLSFDSNAFATATGGNIAQLNSFLGSSAKNGFLKVATDAIKGVEDSINGILPQDLKSLSDQIAAKNQDIGDEQDRIDKLQADLTQQMSAADAAIASLEQQFSYMQSYFQQIQAASMASAGL